MGHSYTRYEEASMKMYEYDGVTNIRASVMRAFHCLGRGIRCIEVGVKDGQHAKIMLDLLQPSYMVLVDIWEDIVLGHDTYCAEAYNECRRLLSDYPQCNYIKGRSEYVLPGLLPDSFDFAYIDAAHDPESVADDVRNCIRVVRVGGIVGGHDYAITKPLQMIALGVSTALHGLDSVNVEQYMDWWVLVTPEMKRIVQT